MNASDWNKRHDRIVPVKYYPTGKGQTAKFIETRTRGYAYHLGSGTAVVPLHGIPGAKPLTQVEAVMPPPVPTI